MQICHKITAPLFIKCNAIIFSLTKFCKQMQQRKIVIVPLLTQLFANFHNSFILICIYFISKFQVVNEFNKFSRSLDPHLNERLTTMARVQLVINKGNEERKKKKEMQKKREAKKAQALKNAK